MLKKLPIQIGILLLLGIIIGVINNSISPNRIPWIQDYIAIDDLGDTLRVPPEYDPNYDSVFTLVSTRKAYILYNNGGIIFVDARTPEDYAKGHIKGAVNLIEGDDDLFYTQLDSLMNIASPDDSILAYCEGITCDASLMLARKLYYDIGYRKIYIYFDGWDEWHKNGLPAEPENL